VWVYYMEIRKILKKLGLVATVVVSLGTAVTTCGGAYVGCQYASNYNLTKKNLEKTNETCDSVRADLKILEEIKEKHGTRWLILLGWYGQAEAYEDYLKKNCKY